MTEFFTRPRPAGSRRPGAAASEELSFDLTTSATTTEEQRINAASYVAGMQAQDAEDAAELLDMLGLRTTARLPGDIAL